jgi:sugar lactone lactonase YvrE
MKLLMDFTCLLDIRCALGESPVLDDRRKLLFFVDVMGPAIHAVRLDGGRCQSLWVVSASPRAGAYSTEQGIF